eukprot:179027_1
MCFCILFDVSSSSFLTQSILILSLWGTEYLSPNPHSRQTAEWVPNDDRRHNSSDHGLDFFVHIDDTQLPSGLNQSQVITAIENAVHTWDNVPCSKNKFNLIISDEHKGQDIGYAEYIWSNGQSGSNRKVGDIVFGGFIPSSLFDGGNQTIGAVTVLFDFKDQIMYQNEGPGEIALAEIYFNDGFAWDILQESVSGKFDIETVALHELGHALSQSHFHPAGKVISSANGMNPNDANDVAMAPLYFGVNHDLHGVDIGGHCSQWANWGSRSGQTSSKQFGGIDLDESDWKADHGPADSNSFKLVFQSQLMVMLCLMFTLFMITMTMACYLCPISIKKKQIQMNV